MEPVLNLKRTSTVVYELCIICQEVKQDTVFAATDKGLATILDAANERRK